MYHRAGNARAAERMLEAPAALNPEDAARLALSRVRKLLTSFTPGVPLDPAHLHGALAAALTAPDQEAERLFALGWLRWLEGDPTAAESLLAEALRQARQAGLAALVPEAAYWHTRVRLLLGHGDAITAFEGVLRAAAGSPQATAWFVDLLARGGRVDRAEQVWKSVRGNRRVLACDEGPLLEARSLLRRGEAVPAERLLHEAAPAGGVVWVERLLLLAWAAAAQKHYEQAQDFLRQAREGPYPEAALADWAGLLYARSAGTLTEPGRTPPALRDLLRGQQARCDGRADEAVPALRAALAVPAAQPFARYALARLGEDDPAAVLAGQPGFFLAVRCRARLALDRFLRREITPAEYLDAVQQAVAAGYRDSAADQCRRLASALQERHPDPDCLRALAAADRNCFRAALELATHVPSHVALDLLLAWAGREEITSREDLRPLLGRHLLRTFFLDRASRDGPAARDADVEATAAALLPQEALVSLARALTAPGTEAANAAPALRLWQAAGAEDVGPWREALAALSDEPRWRPLAQALLFDRAARHKDYDEAAALLDDVDAWRGQGHVPPCFVLRTLRWLVETRPPHPGWRRTLARWLQRWDLAALGPDGAARAAEAGMAPVRGDNAEPPPGTAPAPWLLHQAAQALGRDEAAEALAFTRRALDADPELATVAGADAVRAALPELERFARAEGLVFLFGEHRRSAGLVADAVDLLDSLPQGQALLDAAARGDTAGAVPLLDALAARPDLPPPLAHHLALLEQRAAQRQQGTASALAGYSRAWGHWLRFLAAPDAPAAEARALLLDHLLGVHRTQVNDLLARGAVDGARQHWNLVQGLPARAAEAAAALGHDLAERVARFRDELATEYLLATREAMRYGTIPEGWRADYPKGLDGLRRLLSLDRDNVRLLTAVVEVCGEWFLDLYNAEDAPRLREQLDRYTPFALQLVRLTEGRPGDLAARAALSDFYKFRGFLAGDRAQKAALYREALRFNPANGNVRDLLADLGEEVESPP